MADAAKNGTDSGGTDESGPLKGGRPIDPKRSDATPHPTDEAEQRAREVQSGEASKPDKRSED